MRTWLKTVTPGQRDRPGGLHGQLKRGRGGGKVIEQCDGNGDSGGSCKGAMFFLGGAGEGKRNSRARLPRRFRRTTRVPNRPVLYIIYYAVVFFAATCLQDIGKGVLDPRLPWADTFVVRLRQPVDLVHTLKAVKGLLLLVPPRTPRSSGYDFYAHAFYVVMCSISITCICLLYVLICLCLLCV
jgi:hypothetical protein